MADEVSFFCVNNEEATVRHVAVSGLFILQEKRLYWKYWIHTVRKLIMKTVYQKNKVIFVPHAGYVNLATLSKLCDF